MPQDADRHDVQRLIAAGAQLVEVLPAHEYREEHLADAISIPLKTLTQETTQRLDRTRPVIVYWAQNERSCHEGQRRKRGAD